MGRLARVISIDVVERLNAALMCFQDESDKALTDLAIEVRRAVQWVCEERRDHWKHQLAVREEQVIQARINLERARMFTTLPGERKSCVDEMKALEKARRRLAVAEEKVAAVKRWTRVVDHELPEFQGCISMLASWLQTDQPAAVAALKRMYRALEEYVLLQSTVEGLPPLNLSALLDPPTQGDASQAAAEPPPPAAASGESKGGTS